MERAVTDHDASRLERERIAKEVANMLADDLNIYRWSDRYKRLLCGIEQAIERVRIYERGGELYERK